MTDSQWKAALKAGDRVVVCIPVGPRWPGYGQYRSTSVTYMLHREGQEPERLDQGFNAVGASLLAHEGLAYSYAVQDQRRHAESIIGRHVPWRSIPFRGVAWLPMFLLEITPFLRHSYFITLALHSLCEGAYKAMTWPLLEAQLMSARDGDGNDIPLPELIASKPGKVTRPAEMTFEVIGR